ncbi:hypothetical protein [Microbispora sp. H10830]|nr:hypothetical protein [Microbispora sp. H10830]
MSLIVVINAIDQPAGHYRPGRFGEEQIAQIRPETDSGIPHPATVASPTG